MVKFMKKIFFFFVLIFFSAFPCLFAKGTSIQYETKPYLMDNVQYRRVNPSTIKSLTIVRYTEGGVSEKNIKDRFEIAKFYEYLKRIKLLDVSGMSCTDNTTIYVFNLFDGTKAAVEIECEWIVLNGKSYNFKVEPAKK